MSDFYLTAPQPVDIQCTLAVNSEMTVFSYSCEVILGAGQQDTLVCTVDNIPIVPCKFPIWILYQAFHIVAAW